MSVQLALISLLATSTGLPGVGLPLLARALVRAEREPHRAALLSTVPSQINQREEHSVNQSGAIGDAITPLASLQH